MAPKNSQLMDFKGNAYLKVPGRVQMFREAHPLGVITTELVATDPNIIIRAQVMTDEGTLIATGYGTAPTFGHGMGTWKGKEIEKAETAAVGRALAFAGYGTMAALEDDDAEQPVDAPVARKANAPAANGNHFAGLPEVEPTPANSTAWTHEQAASFNTECKAKGVTPDEALAMLGVSRLSEYAPGFSAARDQLKAYLKNRPQPSAEPAVDVPF